MKTSATHPGLHAQLAAAELHERDALRMARALERLGAPARDVGYALERAATATATREALRRTMA